jgi:hypothetical protein
MRRNAQAAHDLCQLLGRDCQKVVTLEASSYSRFTGADPETQSEPRDSEVALRSNGAQVTRGSELASA